MKEAWVYLHEWSKEMVTTAIENGVDALVVPEGWNDRVKALGRVITVAPDGDLLPGKDVFFEALQSPEDEARIARQLAHGPVVVRGEGRAWEIIPLENLVAHGGRLIVAVRSVEDVDLALGVLEHGVAGVLIEAENPVALQTVLRRVKALHAPQELRPARIRLIRPAGMGDRVCVDTCTLMDQGEGMLVGNSSAFLFLVQAESLANPYVAPRPFRVNAGPVHAYTRVEGNRTRYLSELQAGDTVLVVNNRGMSQPATVGRVKIERRPLLLIEAVCEDGSRGSVLLQNAETIRLVTPGGEAVSVVSLQPGDIILVAVEGAGRHFGLKVDETIHEK